MFVSQAKYDEIVKERDEAVSKVTALTEQLNTANQQLTASVSSDKEARESLASQSSELEAVKADLDTAKTDLGAAISKTAEIEAELNATKESLTSANTELSGLKGQTPPPSKPGPASGEKSELTNREKAKAALDILKTK